MDAKVRGEAILYNERGNDAMKVRMWSDQVDISINGEHICVDKDDFNKYWVIVRNLYWADAGGDK